MTNTIFTTNFNFLGQKSVYHGKVRDVYDLDDKLVVITTDRMSAFDVILPKSIPYKGQVLNQIAAHFLEATKTIVPNWVISVPDPNVTIGHKCTPFKVEMVIRGYLSGHAAREYNDGQRSLSGVPMPDGMAENDKFPEPIITPSTKAGEGHDLDISREEIIKQGLVSETDYAQLEDYTRKLFERGTQMAKQQGLILVDTKYEFGKSGDKIYLIDEIHTPDSSRYFYADGYEERQHTKEPQKQLSKEFLRQWLIANGFQGKDGQQIPEMTDEFITSVSDRYIELFENITGKKFVKPAEADILGRIEKNIKKAI